ncbi:MAG: oxidoreductase [Thermobacillus sp.]|uniref:oxidoreductase n=1 Tax=Thermobacillus sp. TaxID=2108467 RepID=UPI000E3A4F88|nr:oxidoreductase [Thermobacillus sp.]REK54488.1 MAG: oxidoreductase [Thermobacillus sp.]
MKDTLNVGLIGYGFAGKTFHAPVITCVPGLKLAKVVERRTDRAKQDYPQVEIVRDVNGLYADPQLDIVVVTTPSTDHFTFARDALLAGKHVIVEKPFTVTSAEADELIALAKARGLVLSVFHNRRWDGDFQTVREIVRGGKLGRIVSAEFRWDRYNPYPAPGRWRDSAAPGAGVWYDLGVHFLDQALQLFGTPKTIRADIRTQREGVAADDAFDVTLGYENGLSVRLYSSLIVRTPGPRYRLNGTNGSFVKYGEDPQENALKAGGKPSDPGWGRDPEANWGTLDIMQDGLRFTGKVETLPGAYQNYFANVRDAVNGAGELAVKPEEARAAIRLIELGLQSSREGRTIEVSL